MRHLSKHQPILQVLSSANPHLRKAILEKCDKNVVNALIEIILNVLQGHVGMTPKQRKKLQKFKHYFRTIKQKCVSKKSKLINSNKARKTLIQSGGVFPFLIPLIAPLIAKAALSGIVATTAGFATKKLIERAS